MNGFLLLIQLSWRVTFPCRKIRNPRDITNLTTGWSKKTVLCYMSPTDWKTPNGTYHVFYSIVYIGRFNYLPLFYFGPNFCPLKNIGNFLENQWKMAKYTGCHKIIYFPTSNASSAICEGSSSKKGATFSNQFKKLVI